MGFDEEWWIINILKGVVQLLKVSVKREISLMVNVITQHFGLHPSSWTKYVRVVGRIEHPGGREKGSCHEATKKIQRRAQTSGC